MPEEEEGFSVVDKRRVAQDEPAPQQTAESERFDEEEGDYSEFEPTPGALPQLSVRDRIFMSIDILHQGAWIAMGLRADPATGEVEQDLEAARIAIDCVVFLASKIENDLDDATRRELKRIVGDMQMNYVNQAQRAAK